MISLARDTRTPYWDDLIRWSAVVHGRTHCSAPNNPSLFWRSMQFQTVMQWLRLDLWHTPHGPNARKIVSQLNNLLTVVYDNTRQFKPSIMPILAGLLVPGDHGLTEPTIRFTISSALSFVLMSYKTPNCHSGLKAKTLLWSLLFPSFNHGCATPRLPRNDAYTISNYAPATNSQHVNSLHIVVLRCICVAMQERLWRRGRWWLVDSYVLVWIAIYIGIL